MSRRPRDPATDGLLSLRGVLVGGALVLATAAGVALAVGTDHGPAGAVTASGDPGTSGELATPTSGHAATEPSGPAPLRVAVRGPRHLVPGRSSPLELRVGTTSAGPPTELGRVQLTTEIALAPDARGRVLVGPRRLLTSGGASTITRLEATALEGLSCGSDVGTLTVTARELRPAGRSGTATYTIPGVDCDAASVPEAPESLGLQQRVRLDGSRSWRAQVARLLSPTPRSTPRSGHRGATSAAVVAAAPRTAAPSDADDSDAERGHEPEASGGSRGPATSGGDGRSDDGVADDDGRTDDDEEGGAGGEDGGAGGEDSDAGEGGAGGEDSGAGEGGGEDGDGSGGDGDAGGEDGGDTGTGGEGDATDGDGSATDGADDGGGASDTDGADDEPAADEGEAEADDAGETATP